MLSRPSPQYQNIPIDQYMQADEGGRSQQAFANWDNMLRQRTGTTAQQGGPPGQNSFDTYYGRGSEQAWQADGSPKSAVRPSGGVDMSIYSPGMAQPVQQQSTGTPYGQPAMPPMTVNYAPSPYGGTMPFAPPRQQTYYDRSGRAVADPTQVPTFRPTYYDVTGKPVSFDQQQAQRAALVQQTRQADMPFRVANVFNQNIGSNALDYNSVIGQANKMVENGFYNPFSSLYGQGPEVGGTPDIWSRVSQYAPPQLLDATTPNTHLRPLSVAASAQPAKTGDATGASYAPSLWDTPNADLMRLLSPKRS